jgi:DNA mismatch endonuclease (patch repair protein)
MRAVKQFDTAPERALHEALTQLGLSFEKNQRDLPGSPDIVFPKEKVAIFVHGCFWHQHQGCRLATMPKSNKEYWEKKFVANKIRDDKKVKALKDMGWEVHIVWQCTIEYDASKVASELKTVLESKN